MFAEVNLWNFYCKNCGWWESGEELVPFSFDTFIFGQETVIGILGVGAMWLMGKEYLYRNK